MHTETRKHVLMLVYGSVRDDPRVINQGKSLRNAGYRVSVIGAAREGFEPEPTRTTIDGLDVTLIPLLDSIHLGALLRMASRLLRGDPGMRTEPLHQRRDTLRTLVNIVFFWLWVLRLSWSTRCDLVHSHDVIPLPVAWLLGARYAAPYIYDSHEPWRYAYQRESDIKSQIFALIDRIFLPLAGAVIITSEPLRPYIEEGGANRVVNVTNGKHLGQYDLPESAIQPVRERFDLSKYQLVVSYIGFLYPHRGVVELAQAVAQMPDVALLIAGRGDDAGQIERIAADAPNVHWLGWLNLADVPAYTLASDVVYCWLTDDMRHQLVTPNKLSEAMVSGRVLLAQRGVGEMSDVIEAHDAGYLIEGLSVEKLVDAFNALKDGSLRKRLSDNAYALRHDYSWQRAEANLHQLYRDLIGRP